jgi:hypothetical protein
MVETESLNESFERFRRHDPSLFHLFDEVIIREIYSVLYRALHSGAVRDFTLRNMLTIATIALNEKGIGAINHQHVVKTVMLYFAGSYHVTHPGFDPIEHSSGVCRAIWPHFAKDLTSTESSIEEIAGIILLSLRDHWGRAAHDLAEIVLRDPDFPAIESKKVLSAVNDVFLYFRDNGYLILDEKDYLL